MVTMYSKYTAHISSNGSHFLTARVLVTRVLLADQYYNEYFIKMTYILHDDLCQNVLKEKNQARKLKFGVHLRNTEEKTHKNRHHDRTCFG